MTILLEAIYSLILIYSIASYGFLSAATIVVLYGFISCVLMFLLPVSEITNWYTDIEIGPASDIVVMYFIGLSLFAVAAAMRVKAKTRRSAKANSTEFPHVDAERRPTLGWVRQLLTILCVPLFLLMFWHFSMSDFSSAWRYTEYMSSRSAEFYGLSDPISLIAHQLIKPIGLMAALALPAYTTPKIRWLFLTMYSFIFIYVLFVHSVMGSKFVGMMVLLLAVSYFYQGTSRLRVPIFSVLAFIGIWLVVVNFSVRYTRSYGLEEFFRQIFSPEVEDLSDLLRYIYLIAGAAPLLYFAVIRHFDYDFSEILLSFSPLPSFIDGYDNYYSPNSGNTLQFWDTPTGTIWAPVSGFGQIYNFGFVWYLIFGLFLYIFVFVSELARRRLSGVGRFIPAGVFLMGFVIVSMYPVRNGFRFMLVAVVLGGVLLAISRSQRRHAVTGHHSVAA